MPGQANNINIGTWSSNLVSQLKIQSAILTKVGFSFITGKMKYIAIKKIQSVL